MFSAIFCQVEIKFLMSIISAMKKIDYTPFKIYTESNWGMKVYRVGSQDKYFVSFKL